MLSKKMSDCESIMMTTNHISVCSNPRYESILHRNEFEYVKEHFCGNIFTDLHIFTDYFKNNNIVTAHIYLFACSTCCGKYFLQLRQRAY
jgi:hypothetical protein